MRALLVFLAMWLVLAIAPRVEAHGMRSAYLEVVELEPGRARVSLTSAVVGSGLRVVASAPCVLDDGEGTIHLLTCPGGIAGATLRVDGLGSLVSETAVWSRLASGATASTLLTREHPSFAIAGAGVTALATARAYVAFGLRHILGGFDHLLFLLGIVVVQRRVRAVLLAETAFTVSHSITFSANALGWIRVAPRPVEACIALSLVLLALEATRRRSSGSSTSSFTGAALAFVFGSVHGLGFAGGLAEIGLPAGAIPAALAGFAAGVELGQILFLALLLGLGALLGSVSARQRVATLATYTVGSVGMFWLIERAQVLLSL